MEQFLRKNFWVVNLLSLAVMAFFLATGTGTLVSLLWIGGADEETSGPSLARPAPGKREPVKRFQKRSGHEICSTNVFNYKVRPCVEDLTDVGDDDDDEDEEISGAVPSYCTGDGQLMATLASTDADWAFAMIKSDGKTMPYRIGDKVDGVGTIRRVGWRLVLVDAESGPDCLLDLYPDPENEGKSPARTAARATPSPVTRPPSRGAVRGQLSPDLQKQVDEGIEVVSASERAIDRGLVDSLIENSSSLMSQARILPYEREGQVQGFKMYGIRRNSLLGKLGLRNGDIVNSIGGIEMTSPDRALEAYTKLRSSSNITLTYTRRGQRQSMDYNIR
jgi:general secretion pathway protein C